MSYKRVPLSCSRHMFGFHQVLSEEDTMSIIDQARMSPICIEAMRRATRLQALTPSLIAFCNVLLNKHHASIRAHFDDMPEVRDWVWTDDKTSGAS